MQIEYQQKPSVFKNWNEIADGEVFIQDSLPWMACGEDIAVCLSKPGLVEDFFQGEYEVVDAKVVVYLNH